MSHFVTYEFVPDAYCPPPGEEEDWQPLLGIPAEDLATIHGLFEACLQSIRTREEPARYCGALGEKVLASRSDTGHICVMFPLTGGVTPTVVTAVARACALLGCRLVPLDGGRDVAPTAEALHADIASRSLGGWPASGG